MDKLFFEKTLGFSQITKIVEKLSLGDRLKLFKKLQKETYKDRLNEFITSLDPKAISIDDITSEVENIRAQRYENKKA